MRGVDLVAIAAEEQLGAPLELGVVFAQRGEDLVRLRERDVAQLAGQRSPLEDQARARRIAAQLVAALDERRVKRCGAEQRMRSSVLHAAIERLEPLQEST